MGARARLLALGAVLAALFVAVLLSIGRDVDEVRDAIDGAGAWAPVAMVAAAAALTVAFFPFPVVAGAAGVLFGVAEGTAYALAGETLGACAALLIARYAARDAAAELAGPRLRRLLDGVARRGFVAVLCVRILPGVPRHPANYAFGLTAIGLAPFAGATVLGTAPRAFAYAALGGTLGDLRSTESVLAVSLLVAMGVLGLVLVARERRSARAAGSAAATSSPDGRWAGRP